MSSPGSHAFYLAPARESWQAFAIADAPAQSGAGPARNGVLLCPLFGNEDLCAYRARRDWARHLASLGHPTLRIDLPGTGDSTGGPHDGALLERWTAAVDAAARWLARDGTPVTAVGIGLGGLLACRALAAGAPIEDLVLWSVPARGATFVRQLRALAHMEASSQGGGTELPQPLDGGLASAGFVMSEETVTALQDLDITALESPVRARRVLMLERDGLDVDSRLRESLERAGAEVSVAPGDGYGAMVAPPQQSRAPLSVFATVERWLEQAPAAGGSSPTEAPAAADELQLDLDGVTLREAPLSVDGPDGELRGILTEPRESLELCAVLLNAGALRRIGPGRMWVEVARRWAARGVPTLRIDLAGIGDADGDLESLREDAGFYIQRFVAETEVVLDALAERGLPRRFMLAGLCSGGYWAMHAALADERIASVCMINPRALFWHTHLREVRNARNIRKAVRASTWGKLARGEITAERAQTIAHGVAVAMRTLPTRVLRGRRAGGYELEHALDRLTAARTELLGVFTAKEPLAEELERNGDLARMRSHPNVLIEQLPGPLTSHTLEPLPLQKAVHQILDQALDRQLAAQPSRARSEAGA